MRTVPFAFRTNGTVKAKYNKNVVIRENRLYVRGVSRQGSALEIEIWADYATNKDITIGFWAEGNEIIDWEYDQSGTERPVYGAWSQYGNITYYTLAKGQTDWTIKHNIPQQACNDENRCFIEYSTQSDNEEFNYVWYGSLYQDF